MFSGVELGFLSIIRPMILYVQYVPEITWTQKTVMWKWIWLTISWQVFSFQAPHSRLIVANFNTWNENNHIFYFIFYI